MKTAMFIATVLALSCPAKSFATTCSEFDGLPISGLGRHFILPFFQILNDADIIAQCTVTWNKKKGSTDPSGWYTCEGTAKITSSGAVTKFDWQILNGTEIELIKLNGGRTWHFGYIEPPNNYQIQVRESGTANWFTKPLVVPKGCGTK